MPKAVFKSIFILFLLSTTKVNFAGTWSDDFSGKSLSPLWRGDRDNFSILDDALRGFNAHPISLLPLRWIEVGNGWDDYVVECRINVVVPNLLVCTKGALILRHTDEEGYVFALHVATKTVEVYRLSDEELLLSKEADLELERWYQVRAKLQGNSLSFYLDDKLIGELTDRRSTSGAVGLAVQDAITVLFDDFSVTGPKVKPGIAMIKNRGKLPTVWGYIKGR